MSLAVSVFSTVLNYFLILLKLNNATRKEEEEEEEEEEKLFSCHYVFSGQGPITVIIFEFSVILY